MTNLLNQMRTQIPAILTLAATEKLKIVPTNDFSIRFYMSSFFVNKLMLVGGQFNMTSDFFLFMLLCVCVCVCVGGGGGGGGGVITYQYPNFNGI